MKRTVESDPITGLEFDIRCICEKCREERS
jgi:hypothetical protein